MVYVGSTIVPFGIPWCTMVVNVQYYATVQSYHGIPLYTTVNHGIPYTYHGTLTGTWYKNLYYHSTMVHYGGTMVP